MRDRLPTSGPTVDDDGNAVPSIARSGRFQRWRGGLLGIAGLVVLVLLPRLASLPTVRSWLLRRLSSHLETDGMSLEVAEWRLRWLAPCEWVDVTLEAPELSLHMARLRVSRGLLYWIPVGVVRPGSVTVEEPQLRWMVPPPGAAVAPPRVGGTPGEAAASRRRSGRRIRWPVFDVALDLTVTGGQLRILSPERDEHLRLHDIQANIGFDGLAHPLRLDVAADPAVSGAPSQPVSLRLRLDRAVMLVHDPAAWAGSLWLSADQLDLAAFAGVQDFFSPAVRIDQGMLDILSHIRFDGPEVLEVRTEGQLSMLQLRVGNGDAVPVRVPEPLHWRIDSARTHRMVVLRTVEIDGPWMRLSADGELAITAAQGLPQGSIQLETRLNLARILSDFRPVLGIDSRMDLQAAQVVVHAAAEGTPDALRVRMVSELHDWQAVNDGETLVLPDAPRLVASLIVPGAGSARLETLVLGVPPFLRIEGQGTWPEPRLHGKVDLAGIWPLLRWGVPGLPPAPSGQVAWDVSVHGIGDAFRADVSAQMRNGAFPWGAPWDSLQSAAVTLQGAWRKPDGAGWRFPDAFHAIRMEVFSSLGAATATVSRVAWPPESPQQPLLENARVEYHADSVLWESVAVPDPWAALLHDAAFGVIEGDVVFSDTGLEVRRLNWRNALVDGQANGTIRFAPEAERMRWQGESAVNLDRIGTVLRAQGAQLPLPGGHATRPFALRVPASADGGEWPAVVQAEGRLFMGEFRGWGLDAGPSDLIFEMAAGRLRLHYLPPMETGRLELQPEIHLEGPRRRVTHPPANVMMDMPLNDAMMREALVRINPLLADATVLGGRVRLDVQQFDWPLLGDSAAGTLAFLLQFTDVRLQPGGILAEIFAMTGSRDVELRIEEYTLAVSCRDGRVFPAPLTVSAAGHPVTFSGSVGLDGTVSYLVRLPLAHDRLDDRVRRLLQDVTLNVPVGGEIRRLRIDRERLRREIQRFLAEATARAAVQSLAPRLERRSGDDR